MRLRLRIGSALATLLACQCVILAQSAKKTEGPSICKVYMNSYAYDSTLVRIRAVYAGSFEGSYLVDDKCDKVLWFTTQGGNTSVAVALIHSPYPKVPETDFLLVKDKEYEKFIRFAYANGENLRPKYKVTATFTGRIDRCRGFNLDENGRGNGFGQMGQSEFQFILRSVSDVGVEEAMDNIAPIPFGPQSHLPEKH